MLLSIEHRAREELPTDKLLILDAQLLNAFVACSLLFNRGILHIQTHTKAPTYTHIFWQMHVLLIAPDTSYSAP